MTFRPNSLINHREYFDFNPLNGHFFVFRQNTAKSVEVTLESTIQDLKRNRENLSAIFKNEKDFIKRGSIKDEISEIDDEIKKLESIESDKVPSLILQGLESNIGDFDKKLAEEKDISERNAIKEKRHACFEALENRQRKITGPEDLADAIKQIKDDDNIIKTLKEKKLNDAGIFLLLDSDLAPFFDKDFLAQLEIARDKMTTADFVHSTLRPEEREDVIKEVGGEWTEYSEKVKGEMSALENEEKNILSALPEKGLDVRLNDDLEEIRNKLLLMREQLNSSPSWMHKRLLQKERQIPVIENIPAEVLSKLKTYVEQAKFMRTVKIREYLGRRFKAVKADFEKAKKSNTFSQPTLAEMDQDLGDFERALKYLEDPTNITNLRAIATDPSIKISEYIKKFSDPEIFKQLSDNLAKAESALSSSEEEIQDVKKDRKKIESGIVSSYNNLEKLLNLAPDQMGKILSKSQTNPSVTKGQKEILKEFQNPGSDIRKWFAGIKTLIANIRSMDAEELQAIKNEIDSIGRKLGLAENFGKLVDKAIDPDNETAINAHKAIMKLETARSPEEVLNIVEKNLGKDHLMPVSHNVFISRYKEHASKGGFMAFSQKGEELKIVYDRSAVENPNNLRELKKQMTHELLHLEFEKSEDIKRDVKSKFIKQNKKWPEIERAFINYARWKGIEPPTKKGWTEDDILSELYARMNEIGNTRSNLSDPEARLNNLLVDVQAANTLKNIRRMQIKNIDKKIRGYQSAPTEPEEIIRGYEEGHHGEPGGGSKMQGAGQIETEGGGFEELKNKIEGNRIRIKEAKASEYLSYVSGGSALLSAMEKFNENTAKMNEEYYKTKPSEVMGAAIKARVKMVQDDLKKVEAKLGEISAESPNNDANPLRKLWNATNFISVCDIVQMLVDAKEFIKRRHERKKADHAARLGMALFQNLDVGREARARLQKAEMGEVQEWQSRYENLSTWNLIDEIKSLSKAIDPSKDQFKAVLRLLAKKGRIDWRNPFLWEVLNKLQSHVKLIPNDPILLHDPSRMEELLHEAIGEIWDYDEFLTLKRTNDGSYESERKKYGETCDTIQDQLTARLDHLLAAHRAGKPVDPTEFEGILMYCIEKGKSFAENVMFHLLAAQADGLLNADRGMALDKVLNNWPATQWIYAQKPPFSRKDYIKVCETYFKNDYEKGSITQGGAGAQFKSFYWTQIQNNQMVIQRVRKAASERDKWDHDWVRCIAVLGDATTAMRFYSGRSGQRETKETAVENVYVGAIQWLEENSLKPETIDYRFHFARMAGWLAMSEGILDGTAYYRGSTDIMMRSGESLEASTAREAEVGNHKDWTVRQHRNKARAYLDKLDPGFFNIFRGRTAHAEGEEKQQLGILARDHLLKYYPTHADKWNMIREIDDVFNNMDYIIRVFMSKEYMTEERLMGIISAMRP